MLTVAGYVQWRLNKHCGDAAIAHQPGLCASSATTSATALVWGICLMIALSALARRCRQTNSFRELYLATNIGKKSHPSTWSDFFLADSICTCVNLLHKNNCIRKSICEKSANFATASPPRAKANTKAFVDVVVAVAPLLTSRLKKIWPFLKDDFLRFYSQGKVSEPD